MAAKRLSALSAALMIAALAPAAHANVISLSPFAQTVGVGDEVTVQIQMDFIDNTVGGAFDLFYDPALLGLVSFEFDSDFAANVSDPAFTLTPDDCFSSGAAIAGCNVGDGELNAIGVGSFDGIEGTYVVATVVFEALAAGTSALNMAVNDAPFDGFYSSVDASELSVLFGPAKVRITAPVPLPGAAWLLISALAAAGAVRRRQA